MSGARPTLWHIPVSHFSEKARWALAHKALEHDRRAPMPGLHIPVALALTRGRGWTLPILQLEGRAIGDSTAIIAALERLRPEPPLYPSDPGERRRALELEDFFDERLGPQIRRLAWHELRGDRDRMERLAVAEAPPPIARFGRLAGAYARGYTAIRYRAASDSAAGEARAAVIDALDRLESELGPGDYLVGERFTVADLTAAALFYPLVLPPEGPRRLDMPEPFARFRDQLAARRGFAWVLEMFRRHRGRSDAPSLT